MADKPHPSRKPLEGDAAKPENWTASVAASATPEAKKRKARTLLQSQAAIERIMNELPANSWKVVLLWMQTQYNPVAPPSGGNEV